jgi:hypothetical protein
MNIENKQERMSETFSEASVPGQSGRTILITGANMGIGYDPTAHWEDDRPSAESGGPMTNASGLNT